MADRIIIIHNMLVEDCKIKKVLDYIESSAFQAKALSTELFELSMRSMMHGAGILVNRVPREPSITRLAMSTLPSRSVHQTEEEHDELYDEQYETISYATEEMSNHVNHCVVRAFQAIPLDGQTFKRAEFYYGVPENAITLVLTNRSIFDESPNYNHYR